MVCCYGCTSSESANFVEIVTLCANGYHMLSSQSVHVPLLYLTAFHTLSCIATYMYTHILLCGCNYSAPIHKNSIPEVD